MKLTILGNEGPFPSAGGACSGYLIREGSRNILLDCGNGVLSNLQRFISYEELDAIVLTHLHSDHMSDMMVLKYALQIKKNRGLTEKIIDVYAPDEPREEYNRLDVKEAYNLKTITEDLVLTFGNLKLNFCEVKHPVKCFAVSAENGRKRFVFSGDTSWNERIIGFSREADLLMLDAGLLTRDKTSDDVPHLTAKECGIVAKEAEAKRLLLTHFWPEYDRMELIKEAKEKFYSVEASELLETYEI
ncbi:MAG: MBL fold metallo-hydrolase [Acetivibrionales bacterium]|jgi:ribonuclease BN (tRNA processing enzyme)